MFSSVTVHVCTHDNASEVSHNITLTLSEATHTPSDEGKGILLISLSSNV